MGRRGRSKRSLISGSSSDSSRYCQEPHMDESHSPALEQTSRNVLTSVNNSSLIFCTLWGFLKRCGYIMPSSVLTRKAEHPHVSINHKINKKVRDCCFRFQAAGDALFIAVYIFKWESLLWYITPRDALCSEVWHETGKLCAGKWEISIQVKIKKYRGCYVTFLLIMRAPFYSDATDFWSLTSTNEVGAPLRCIRQVMYMYLLLPKDPSDAGTPVAPEEQNIVDMPAMELSFFPPVWGSFHGCSCVLQDFSESCFAEKCQQPSSGLVIISSKGIINQADIPRMVWHKTNTLSPAACARLKSSFPQFILYFLSALHWVEF